MTVLIKVGRRVPRAKGNNWFSKRLNKARNLDMIQSHIWKTVGYGLGLATAKMGQYQKKNPDTFQFTKTKYKEKETLNYDIEWIEIVITSTPELEEEEYNASLKLFSNLENLPVLKKYKEGDNVEIDEELAANYAHKVKKGKVKKMLDAGYERVKGLTLSKSLNDVGILTIVERYNKEND